MKNNKKYQYEFVAADNFYQKTYCDTPLKGYEHNIQYETVITCTLTETVQCNNNSTVTRS